MAMFPALMNDTMFSDLFDDPFFEGWRNMDRAAACNPNMSAGMMSTDVRETDKGYMVDIDMPGFKKDDISLERLSDRFRASQQLARGQGRQRPLAASRTLRRLLLS